MLVAVRVLARVRQVRRPGDERDSRVGRARRRGEGRDARGVGRRVARVGPRGRFLYFLSSRELEPTYDAHGFGMSFRAANRPHALALRADVRNPLLRPLRPPHDGASDEEEEDSEEDSDSEDSSESSYDDAPPPIEITFEGLHDRVVALPMPAGRYANLVGLDDGRFMVVRFPPARPTRVGLDAPYYADGSDDSDDDEDGSASTGALLRFDVERLKTTTLIDGGFDPWTCRWIEGACWWRSRCPGRRNSGAYKAGAKPDDEDSDGEEVDEDAFDRASGPRPRGKAQDRRRSREGVGADVGRDVAEIARRLVGSTHGVWRRGGEADVRGDGERRRRRDAFGNDIRERGTIDARRTPKQKFLQRADWNGILETYAGVLPRVATRSESSPT